MEANNNQVNMETYTDYGLTREQESCLKKELMKLVVEDEVKLYMQDTSMIDQTLFLKFAKNLILHFPLLDNREKSREMLQEFIMHDLPHLLTITQKATKHDTQNRKLRIAIVSIFNVAIRTKQEKNYDKRYLNQDFNAAAEAADCVDPLERTRKSTLREYGQKLSQVSQGIFSDLIQASGVSRLFAIVRNAGTVEMLPQKYQMFLTYWGKLVSVQYEKRFADPKQVSMMKRLNSLTPSAAVHTILRIAEPVSILQGLVKLCIARPLGAHNLVQKWAEVITEIKRSKKDLSEAQHKMSDALHRLGHGKARDIEKWVHTYVQTSDLPVPEEEAYTEDFSDIQYNSLVPVSAAIEIVRQGNVIPPYQLASLTKEEVQTIYEVLLLELRIKEKEEFVEILGSPKIIEVMREVIPIFYGPFASLFGKNEMIGHFDRWRHSCKSFVEVSKGSEHLPVDQRFELYERVAKEENEALYAFMHGAALNDMGDIEKCINWYVDFLRFVHDRESLDIQALMTKLSDEKRAMLSQQLTAVLDYWKLAAQGKQPEVKPEISLAAELKAEFLEMMKLRLSPQPAAQQPQEQAILLEKKELEHTVPVPVPVASQVQS